MQISPKIVGILNISPDSFSDGKTYDENSLINRINYLKNAKADIIDVGAESTAPNSLPVSLEEELKRLKIFFEVISEFPDITFSLDTMKTKVAEIGIKNGVKIINDVSGGRFDNEMFELIAKNPGVKYVMMYSKNSSGRADLIENKDNVGIIDKITNFFDERLDQALKSGINKSQIILDPGMGAFLSTDFEDSVEVLRNINFLKQRYGIPIFIGTSRKGFLSKICPDFGPQDRLGSSLASIIYASQNGADYIRVHDVKETRQFIDTYNFLNI